MCNRASHEEKSDTPSHIWTASLSLEEIIFFPILLPTLAEFWIELVFKQFKSSCHNFLFASVCVSTKALVMKERERERKEGMKERRKEGRAETMLALCSNRLGSTFSSITWIPVWIRKTVDLRKIGCKFYHPIQFSHSHTCCQVWSKVKW